MRAGHSPVGRRIHVTGNSCSGKTTVAARLARTLGVPLVELDALNWLPGWVGLHETDPAELERRIRTATEGSGWVVAGHYMTYSQRTFWPRLQTVIWLDLPLRQLVGRVLARSLRRWRTRELLWGTNRERFWPQLALWNREDSLLWWILAQHGEKRRRMVAQMADRRWSGIRFVRLASSRQIETFVRAVERAVAPPEAATGGARRSEIRPPGEV